MRLYLMQHGIANPEEIDPEKHLSEKGKKETGRVAEFLAQRIVASKICHSPKARAKETAAVLAENLGVAAEEIKGIAPMDDPAIIAEKIKDGLVLVGHLPHLARLCSLLVLGDADADIVTFCNSGIVCLEEHEETWGVAWAVTPDII